MEKSQPIRVVIVDDHLIMRDGLRRFLEKEPDIEVVGDAPDTVKAMGLVHQLKPDILTTDLSHPGSSGFDLLYELKYGETPVKAIVLTAAIPEVGIIEAFYLGARGVVLKDSASQVLLDAIRRVAAGGYWIHREPVSDLAEYMQTLVRKLFPPGGQA